MRRARFPPRRLAIAQMQCRRTIDSGFDKPVGLVGQLDSFGVHSLGEGGLDQKCRHDGRKREADQHNEGGRRRCVSCNFWIRE